MVVEVYGSGSHVDHEQDDIGLFDSQRHLLVDLFFKNIFRINDPSTGVDNGKLLPAPLDLAILAIAGRAGLFVDDGLAGLRQAVKQGRRPYVRASYDCYYISHNFSFFFTAVTAIGFYSGMYPNPFSLFSRLRQSFSTLT